MVGGDRRLVSRLRLCPSIGYIRTLLNSLRELENVLQTYDLYEIFELNDLTELDVLDFLVRSKFVTLPEPKPVDIE